MFLPRVCIKFIERLRCGQVVVTNMENNTENVDIELLIQLVKGYPCLYDKRNKDYKGIVQKENCWKDISESLHISTKNCEEIFKKLKHRFIRERKNIKKSTSGEEAPEINRKWIWYENMEFLNEHILQRRRNVTNMKRNSVATVNSQMEDDNELEET